MCDVEKHIEQWRNDLAASDAFGGSDVDELESHLREELKQLETSGLSADEAFLVASRRLGGGPALETEFAKAHPHRRLTHRLRWMVIGILSYYLVLKITSIATWGSAWLGYIAGLRTWWHLAVFAGMAWLPLLAAGVWWVQRRHAAGVQATVRKASLSLTTSIVMACAIVGLWWLEGLPYIILDRIVPHECFTSIYGAHSWAGFGWGIAMPFLLVAVLATLSVRRQQIAGKASVTAASRDEGQEAGDLESRLHEEIERLIASGLSGEEALLIARRRQGDADAQEVEFTRTCLSQPHANRLSWMVIGVLGYLFTSWVSTLASSASAWFGYVAGVRNVWLVLAAGAVHALAFALIVICALRYHAWRAQTAIPSARISLGPGLFAATAIAVSWRVTNLARPFLYRRISEDGFVQIVDAWRWVAFGWTTLLPFLLAAAMVIHSTRRKLTVQNQR